MMKKIVGMMMVKGLLGALDIDLVKKTRAHLIRERYGTAGFDQYRSSLDRATDKYNLKSYEQRNLIATAIHESGGFLNLAENNGNPAYTGRGMIQITTQENYDAVARKLRRDGIDNNINKRPDVLIEDPRIDSYAACAFHRLNRGEDHQTIESYTRHVINPADRTMNNRLRHWNALG